MAKILAVAHDADRVYLAMVKNGAVETARSVPIVSAKNNSEGIAAAIRNLTAKNEFRESTAAMALPDVECVFRQLSPGNVSERELEMNLPYEFGDYISAGSEENYIFDYQVLPAAKGEPARLLCVAAQRKAIAACADIAEDAKLNLVRLAPETVALGDLVEAGSLRGKLCCLISVGADSALVRIYRGVECLASHEVMGGVLPVREALQLHNLTFFDGSREERAAVYNQSICRRAVESVCAGILNAMAYFLERRILVPYTPVFLMGEGALIPGLRENLSRGVGADCVNVSALIPGRIDDELAAMLAPAVGAALLR